MSWLPLVATAAVSFLLSGCSPEEDRSAERAEARFDFISENHGGNRDRCDAARSAAEAWATREDRRKFEHWKTVRDAWCTAADESPYSDPDGGKGNER